MFPERCIEGKLIIRSKRSHSVTPRLLRCTWPCVGPLCTRPSPAPLVLCCTRHHQAPHAYGSRRDPPRAWPSSGPLAAMPKPGSHPLNGPLLFRPFDCHARFLAGDSGPVLPAAPLRRPCATSGGAEGSRKPQLRAPRVTAGAGRVLYMGWSWSVLHMLRRLGGSRAARLVSSGPGGPCGGMCIVCSVCAA